MISKFLTVMLTLSLWGAGGCGYSVRSVLPATFRTIHVLPFSNKIIYSTDQAHNSYIPLMEVKVRNAIVERYLFDGNLKIADEETADLVLKGELTGFERNVLRYTESNDVQEYRIHIVVSLTMLDPSEAKALWTEPAFVGEATYFLTGPQAKSEAAAIEDALTDLARRVVERTIEDW